MTALLFMVLLDPVRVGDIEVGKPKAELIRIAIKKPERLPEYAGGAWLRIYLPLRNRNEDRKAVCTQWLFKPNTAKLTDDLGNEYKMYVLPTGADFVDTIDPEIRIPNDDDGFACLLFESPIPKAGKLTLELAGENIGGKGKFKVVIPASAWK